MPQCKISNALENKRLAAYVIHLKLNREHKEDYMEWKIVRQGLHYRIVNKIMLFWEVITYYFSVPTVTRKLSRWIPVIEKRR